MEEVEFLKKLLEKIEEMKKLVEEELDNYAHL